VLGVLPGIIGSIQANETIKILLGKGETLSGRLLLFDAMRMTFRTLKLRRDPSAKPITELIDYQQFCGVVSIDEGADAAVEERFSRAGAVQVKSRLDDGWKPFVLDVRKPHEAEIASLDFVDLLRAHEAVVAGHLEGIPTDRPILVHCKSGGRSAKAAKALVDAGYEDVTNLEGGINGWAKVIDPALPQY